MNVLFIRFRTSTALLTIVIYYLSVNFHRPQRTFFPAQWPDHFRSLTTEGLTNA